jgi:DNA modification methylase
MPKRKRQPTPTTTSAFGSPGRVSHDATPFYASRLYHELSQEQTAEYHETPVPPENLDRIYCASSERMAELPENSIHLMVTSPPYNVGKEYDEDLTLEEYLRFLKVVWKEVQRVLVPGGRACINVANLGRKPYIPLHAFIVRDLLELGFLMRGEIIWDKAASASTAWGSWLSAANPTLRDVHEYILVFSKGAFRRQSPIQRPSTITRGEFLEYSKSVWHFPAKSAKKIGHPAPFPIELPRRLIQLYTYAGEIVLDPFIGSGQTALAALQTGRHYAGYEIDPAYVELAEGRLREFVV